MKYIIVFIALLSVKSNIRKNCSPAELNTLKEDPKVLWNIIDSSKINSEKFIDFYLIKEQYKKV